MKVLAQSTVVSRPGYLHLGYLAAATVDVSKPFVGVGIGLLILGFLIATKFRIVRTERGRRILGILRKPPVWAAVGMAMSVGGAAIVWLGPKHEKIRAYQHPQELTQIRMQLLNAKVLARQEAGSSIPDDIAELGRNVPRDHDFTQDGWLRTMRLRKEGEGNHTRYALASAGPDGQFDTNDDIIFEPQSDTPATTPSR
jgi:hypothetical protein